MDAIERGERPTRRALAVDVVTADGEVDRRVRPVAHRRADQEDPQGRDQQGQGVRHQRSCREHDGQEHARQGSDRALLQEGRRRAARVRRRFQDGRGARAQADLRSAPSWRRAGHAHGEAGARAAVLLAEALRPRSRRSLQDQPAARPQHAGRPDGAHEGRFRRDRPLPRRTPRGPRPRRRHRPPGQPPHPLGR